MPVKNFRIFLFILLILIAACSPLVEKSVEVDPATPVGTPTETSHPTLPDGFLTSHPWGNISDYTQLLSQATFDSQDFLSGASLYHISLNIPKDLTAALTGKLAVQYTNQENTDLNEVVFRLFPNYYGGSLTIEDLQVDDQPASSSLESENTTLRVALPATLVPGETTIISMDFTLVLPESMGGNYGLFGYFDNILVLDTFYPMIPAYDQSGWYAHYPYTNGDLTYQDASYYLVDVVAPADFVIASSGSAIATQADDQVQKTSFIAGPARDYYLAGSTDFTVVSKDMNGIQVNSYATTGHPANQEKALTYAAQALETFSDLFGSYPYTEFDVISSPMQALGIEYPGITGIFLDLYEEGGEVYGIPNDILLESVIVHEVAHQWFYNLVGNDQQNQPWVDESITQYVTYWYFSTRHMDSKAAGLVYDWQSRLTQVEDAEIPIGLSADSYDGVEYSAIVYGRGPLFYRDLATQIGQETLIDALRQYLQDYRWKTANSQAIQTELEDACSCDLSDNFNTWILPENGSGN